MVSILAKSTSSSSIHLLPNSVLQSNCKQTIKDQNTLPAGEKPDPFLYGRDTFTFKEIKINLTSVAKAAN